MHGRPYFRNFTVARLRAKSETLVNVLIVYSNKKYNRLMLNGDKNENGKKSIGLINLFSLYVLFSV